MPEFFRPSYSWRAPGQATYPLVAGSLAVDNYDPTFGDGGLGLGPDVYECLACGSAVINTEKHIGWHEKHDN